VFQIAIRASFAHDLFVFFPVARLAPMGIEALDPSFACAVRCFGLILLIRAAGAARREAVEGVGWARGLNVIHVAVVVAVSVALPCGVVGDGRDGLVVWHGLFCGFLGREV